VHAMGARVKCWQVCPLTQFGREAAKLTVQDLRFRDAFVQKTLKPKQIIVQIRTIT
jgi:hypothetical protein